MKNSNLEKIKLNKNFGQLVKRHGYELDATKKYVINLKDELDEQSTFVATFKVLGCKGFDSFYKFCRANGFDESTLNVTNEFVAEYYGKKPLWRDEYSQGVVVKNEEEDDEDYYIVIECSNLVTGWKYAQIIATLGGCL